MLSWIRLSHIADWCQARVEGSGADFPIKNISTDSRAIKKGDLFLALKGENFDGHDFVEAAIRQGASAVIAERSFKVGVPVLVVDNALKALAAIGAQLRASFKGKVAAVTGSAGKSSTKDMVASLLGPDTVSSPASFNNLMGVSRTLFLIEDSTRYLMLEMGMNAPGEIKELCEHFHPQVGAITNIGDAHIGKLGGKRGIYQAKKELFDYLARPESRAAGVALNINDPLVVEAYRESFKSPVPTIRYSASGAEADVRILRKEMDSRTGFLSLSLKVKDKPVEARFPIFGLHHAENIAAAISVALLLGVSLEEMLGRFDCIRPAYHRGEVIPLPDDRILIDESYNSNPTALISSLTSLCDLDISRRRVLVIGDMRELGEFSEKLHAQAGEALAALHAKRPFPFLLIGVGEQISHFIEGVRARIPEASCQRVASASAALSLLPPLLHSGDVVFVKGSRGIVLDKVVDGLVRN